MNRYDIEDHYIFIRMWCPPAETAEPKVPHYVQRLDRDKGVEWTLTRVFEESALFKSEKIAKRLVKAVARIRSRIERGWLYEVVKVTEEVLEHNLPSAPAEDEKEDAA
jgi:hypothetical protein